MSTPINMVRFRKDAIALAGYVLFGGLIGTTLVFVLLWRHFVQYVPHLGAFIGIMIVLELFTLLMCKEWTIYLFYKKGIITILKEHFPSEFRFLSSPYLISNPLRNALEATCMVVALQFVVLSVASTLNS